MSNIIPWTKEHDAAYQHALKPLATELYFYTRPQLAQPLIVSIRDGKHKIQTREEWRDEIRGKTSVTFERFVVMNVLRSKVLLLVHGRSGVAARHGIMTGDIIRAGLTEEERAELHARGAA